MYTIHMATHYISSAQVMLLVHTLCTSHTFSCIQYYVRLLESDFGLLSKVMKVPLPVATGYAPKHVKCTTYV